MGCKTFMSESVQTQCRNTSETFFHEQEGGDAIMIEHSCVIKYPPSVYSECEDSPARKPGLFNHRIQRGRCKDMKGHPG